MPYSGGVGGGDESDCLKQNADQHWWLSAEFAGDDRYEGCYE